MGEKDYTISLSPNNEDWYRHYHRVEKKRVVRFRIPYEAYIEEAWRTILRRVATQSEVETIAA